METNMIRSLDGGAFQDPVVIDPDTGSNVLSDAAKRPTDFIIGTDFAATLSRSVTLAAYRMGYAVSTRPPPTTTAVAAAFASYAQSGLALSMSFQRSASGGTAATANPRDPRENATISGQVLVNSTTGSTTGATLAANELWAQLMLLGSGTPEYYQSGDALITDRYGALLTPAYVVGPALDGTQPFLAPVSGLNHALAAFDTHYTGSALARNIGAALFRADSHAFRTPMWLTDKSHPMLQGVELNTDVGKRLAEISVRATIHVAIGIYSRQLTRLALEIWDPLVRTLSSAPAMEIADADALKRWDSIIGAYRKYVPLHPALGLLPPGRPRVDAPEGSGAAFVVPAADANTVADLFDNAHRMPGTVSPAMTFIWNVVPGLRFLRGEAGHNPTNPVDISLSQIATDALALEMIERESPGLMAYAAAQLPFDRPSTPISYPDVKLDRIPMAWVSEAGTSVPIETIVRGELAAVPTASLEARPFTYVDQQLATAGITIVPLDRDYTIVRPSIDLSYVTGSWDPPRMRPISRLLGSAHNPMTVEQASRVLRRIRSFITAAQAITEVTLAGGPYRVQVLPATPTTPAIPQRLAYFGTLRGGIYEPTSLGANATPLGSGLLSGEGGYFLTIATTTSALSLEANVPASPIEVNGVAVSDPVARFLVAEIGTNFAPLAAHVPLIINGPTEGAHYGGAGGRKYVLIRGTAALAVSPTPSVTRRATRAHPATTHTAEAFADMVAERLLTFTRIGESSAIDLAPIGLGGGL